jgi:hypothetical protein
MSENLFDENDVVRINLRDYEIVHEPAPQNETPRQFVLRMTGNDVSDLTSNGRDLTWQEVKDAGALPIIERMIQTTTYVPPMKLRRKEPTK